MRLQLCVYVKKTGVYQTVKEKLLTRINRNKEINRKRKQKAGNNLSKFYISIRDLIKG